PSRIVRLAQSLAQARFGLAQLALCLAERRERRRNVCLLAERVTNVAPYVEVPAVRLDLGMRDKASDDAILAIGIGAGAICLDYRVDVSAPESVLVSALLEALRAVDEQDLATAFGRLHRAEDQQ